MDPSFTRMIKLDILATLTLDPISIEAVLKELRTYVRHDDADFVRASVRAVGRVAELTRVAHDRRGIKTGDVRGARRDADIVALNCLSGLLSMSERSDDGAVVGECVGTMAGVMLRLMSTGAGGGSGTMRQMVEVDDPNMVQSAALRRLLLLLVRSLAGRPGGNDESDEADDGNGEEGVDEKLSSLRQRTVVLPPSAVAPALWLVGEWMCAHPGSTMFAITPFNTTAKDKLRMRSELLRLVARTFPDLDPIEKVQAIHFASKALFSSKEADGRKHRADNDSVLCEHLLGMGRTDVRPDIRDRARYESHMLHIVLGGGLTSDAEGVPPPPSLTGGGR